MPKIWKSNGPEQAHLESLFESGEVNGNMRTKEVQQNYDIFKGFSDPVFRQHFNKTKKMFNNNRKDLFCACASHF